MTPNQISQVKKESNEREKYNNFTAYIASVIEELLKKETLSESCESSEFKVNEMTFASTYETLYNECLSLK